jgi:hypothetical protein
LAVLAVFRIVKVVGKNGRKKKKKKIIGANKATTSFLWLVAIWHT